MTSNLLKIVMMGATGAVGTQTLRVLLKSKNIKQLTLLGRTPIKNIDAHFVEQHEISIFEPKSYQELLEGHHVAICTLGVGEPSKISKEEFVAIDKTAVINFAKACKKAGIKHFELLASVGINSKSPSFYLKTKGELVEALESLNFERLSIFKPSMILTPTNRYGLSQAITLKVFPVIKPLLIFGLRKYRGIPVEVLGKSMALNIYKSESGVEMLYWDDFYIILENNKD